MVADSAFADIRNVMVAELEEKTDVPAAALRLFGPGITFIAQLVFDLNLSEIPPLTAVPAIAPRPILFIHGEDDTRVPVEQTRALFHADLSTTNDLWVLPGAGTWPPAWPICVCISTVIPARISCECFWPRGSPPCAT